MSSSPVPVREQVRLWGPDRTTRLQSGEAIAYCRALANSHYENFSVVSSLVPRALRDDFAAVYSFCRWADDLGDEIEDRDESLRLLAWWREELDACFAGEPVHPVMVALAATVERHDLPRKPFDDLVDAFVQDQSVTRYETWKELLEYCSLSANPVGRLVLMLLGEERDESLFQSSDSICTALQLTNHWQDVRRDFDERDRIYIPSELIDIDLFEERLRASVGQGFAVDGTFLEESRQLVRECVARTMPLYDEGSVLLDRVSPQSLPVIRLFVAGGMRVLRLIELWNFETAIHRPTLSKVTKVALVARAWMGSRFARNSNGTLSDGPSA
jgi:squalene synthase HpnC